MITKFFIPELNNHGVQELWFQQDGATCHTARATIDLLKDTFGDRLISRFGPVNWPPRSCDLTPLDYFLKQCSMKSPTRSLPTTTRASSPYEKEQNPVEKSDRCHCVKISFMIFSTSSLIV
ncbi:putative transposable element [Trichonephila clavipes]|nr:putative transposable element [Trichonephila clavipes]